MEKASSSEDSPQSKNETNNITSDEVKAPKSNQAWQSATLILAAAVIGLASYAIVQNYKNHEATKTNDELVEVISERDTQIEKLKKRLGRSYVDVIINTPEEPTEEPQEPEETEPQEPEQTDEEPILNYVKSDGYVYIPHVGKKVKVSDKFQTVYYTYDGDFITLWGVTKDAKQSSYDYMDLNKNRYGVGRLTVVSDDFLKYSVEKYGDPSFYFGEVILSINKNSVYDYSSSHAVFSENKESQDAELKATNAFKELFNNKDNYEDM